MRFLFTLFVRWIFYLIGGSSYIRVVLAHHKLSGWWLSTKDTSGHLLPSLIFIHVNTCRHQAPPTPGWNSDRPFYNYAEYKYIFFILIFFSYTGVKFLKDRVTEEKLIVHSDTAPRSVCQIRLNSQHCQPSNCKTLVEKQRSFYNDLTSFKGVKTLNLSKYVSPNISELKYQYSDFELDLGDTCR